MSSQIQSTLAHLGLTKHEVAAYVALLQMGKGSADSVASRANIKRSTAYLALESLLRQGLIGKVPRARKMIFVAKDPTEIEAIVAERMSEVSRTIPLLRSMAASADGFNTVLYEGVTGIKSAMAYKMDELRDTSFVGFYAYVDAVDASLIEFTHQWNEKNARRNIRSRAIVPDHPSLESFREADVLHLREVKVIPASKYPSQVSIEVYDDFVRVVMYEQQAAVIMQSKAMSQTLKSVFELLWESLE